MKISDKNNFVKDNNSSKYRKSILCDDNKKNILKVKRIGNADIPRYSTKGSVGLDLVANDNYIIEAGNQVLIKTGLVIEIPSGYVGLICSRSGLAINDGIFVLNSPGIIDPDYCGNDDEIRVILYNNGSVHEEFIVTKGDRIAQLIILQAPKFEILEVEKLSNKNRRGFGSTGIR